MWVRLHDKSKPNSCTELSQVAAVYGDLFQITLHGFIVYNAKRMVLKGKQF